MNLYPDAFELIENGSKKVEMRLNDEKRQKLTIGDLVTFTNTETKEEIIVEVIDLNTFKSLTTTFFEFVALLYLTSIVLSGLIVDRTDLTSSNVFNSHSSPLSVFN